MVPDRSLYIIYICMNVIAGYSAASRECEAECRQWRVGVGQESDRG